jgi:hypothetical protein
VPDTANVTVDQSRLENQGKWLKLGSSYFNVASVQLSSALGDRHLRRAADAVMWFNTIDAFSYSSPVFGKIAPAVRVCGLRKAAGDGCRAPPDC